MALNYDLSNQQIKNTYEQLVQVSASVLVDGTGSLVDSLDYVTNPTFTSYTSSTATSTSASIANLQTQIDSLEAGSGSADWPLITNKPSGLVSSSAQIATDISGAFTSTSASIASDIATNKSDIATKLDSSTFTSFSSSAASDIATNTSDISTQTSRVDSLVSATSSYAVKTSDNTFTGTQTFNNISVNGTASIAVLQSVTGSAKIIGDAFIQLNTDTPAQRYAGLQVVDSGSTADTASLIWDSQTNDWFYEYEGDDPTDHGVLLFGPEYGTKGSPAYPTNNVLQKGDGGHHLVDSSITDTGTSVSMSAPLTASGFQGDLDGTATSASFAVTASYALNAEGAGAGLVNGTGTDSIRSSDDLTTTPAVAGGNYSVVIGEQASDGNQNEVVAIGFNNEASQRRAVGIGLDNNMQGDSSIAIGNSNSATGPDAIVIGKGAQATTDGIAMGDGTQAAQNAVGIGNGPSAGGQGSVVIGNQSAGDFNGSIAIGDNAFAQATEAIAIGKNVTVNTTANEISIGNIFKYDGTSTITLEGDLIKVADSASATGSLIDNVHPAIASGSPAIQHIVTINQDAYTTISGSGNVYDDTLYIISDATSTGIYDGDLNVTGFLDVDSYISASGNVEVGGQVYSPTFAGSVASSTSSIDFNNGNFATLNLTSATFLANPTNLKSGTTYTIILDSGSLISNHGSAWKFAGGTAPTYSNGTDVLTAVSDGTNLYATALTDFS